MDVAEPKYRHKLNEDQVEILELLYKFRFGTVALIRKYFVELNPGMDVFRKLRILEERGFIIKRYLREHRLLHKPVAYCLSPSGARELIKFREADSKSKINMKAIYGCRIVKEPFIEHCFDVFGIYNQLMGCYGNDLDFFSKSDLAGYAYFPRQLPDALLALAGEVDTARYFLEFVQDSLPFFAVNRRIKQYVEFKKSGTWANTGTKFPAILFVCQSANLQKQVDKRIASTLRKELIAITFATTMQGELTSLSSNSDEIWHKDGDTDTKLSLRSIS